MSSLKLGKLDNVKNIGPQLKDDVHGYANKSLIVLHETVSPDYAGWKDIDGVSEFLDKVGYGIHGIVDAEGNVAWTWGLGKAIFYHTQSGAGGVNTRSIGIEQVSRVMLDYPDRKSQLGAWLTTRDEELKAVAKLMAWISDVHDIPLVSSNGSTPGVTTHWEVTKTYKVAGGHVDCWPYHLGGYYPKLRVIALAKAYQKLGV